MLLRDDINLTHDNGLCSNTNPLLSQLIDITILLCIFALVQPRAKIKYNIKGIKIDPFFSYEAFYDITLKEWFKGRYDIGASRDFGKHHEIGLYYRHQDYYYNRNSVSILGINYEFKF